MKLIYNIIIALIAVFAVSDAFAQTSPKKDSVKILKEELQICESKFYMTMQTRVNIDLEKQFLVKSLGEMELFDQEYLSYFKIIDYLNYKSPDQSIKKGPGALVYIINTNESNEYESIDLVKSSGVSFEQADKTTLIIDDFLRTNNFKIKKNDHGFIVLPLKLKEKRFIQPIQY